MSGRIRTLKPELLDDERIGRLSDTARVLFEGMILLADDYGNLRSSPSFLKSRIWSYREPAIAIEVAIAEVVGPLVMIYEASDQKYAHIRNWSKHQKVEKPGRPRVPLHPGAPNELFENFRESPEKVREVLSTDLGPPTRTNDHDQEQTCAVLDAAETGDAPPTDASAVRHVFEHWVSGWSKAIGGKRPPILNAKRTKAIRARLNEGRTAEELCHAVDGLWRSDFHVRGGHTDVELVCRDDAHVIRFIAIADGRVTDSRPSGVFGARATIQPTDDDAPWMKLEGFGT